MTASEAAVKRGKEKRKSKKSKSENSKSKKQRVSLESVPSPGTPDETAPWEEESEFQGLPVEDTAVSGHTLDPDSEIVLVRISGDGSHLHGMEIMLPDARGRMGHVDDMVVNLDPSRGVQNMFLLGCKSGTVTASKISSAYDIRPQLPDVDVSESDVDEDLLLCDDEVSTGEAAASRRPLQEASEQQEKKVKKDKKKKKKKKNKDVAE